MWAWMTFFLIIFWLGALILSIPVIGWISLITGLTIMIFGTDKYKEETE